MTLETKGYCCLAVLSFIAGGINPLAALPAFAASLALAANAQRRGA